MNNNNTQITMASTRRLLANGVDWFLITGLRNRFILKYFVETGTADGNTIVNASELFKRVWSIETDSKSYQIAKDRTKELPNVVTHLGTSQDILPKICDELNKPTLFYLDAHWCGGETTNKPQCPILEEIAILQEKRSGRGDIIIIDDANLFLNPVPPPLDPGQWPNAQRIVDLVRETSPNTYAKLINNQIVLSPEPLTINW